MSVILTQCFNSIDQSPRYLQDVLFVISFSTYNQGRSLYGLFHLCGRYASKNCFSKWVSPNLSTITPYASVITVPAITSVKNEDSGAMIAMLVAVPAINSAARAPGTKDLRYLSIRVFNIRAVYHGTKSICRNVRTITPATATP